MNAPQLIPELSFSPGFESELITEVKKSGVVKVSGAIDPEMFAALNCEFDEILKSDEVGLQDLGVEIGRACNVIPAKLAEGRYPNLRKYFSLPWMQVASDLYWGDPRILNDNIFVTQELPGTQHLAQDLHFDVQETLKFFLYLNDVTRENGAFSCVPGSVEYTKQVRADCGNEISYENREISRQHPFGEEEIIPVEGAAGTLIVFTTEVWHRAGLVQSGERRVMRGHTRTRVPENAQEREVRSPKKKTPVANPKRNWIQRLFKR